MIEKDVEDKPQSHLYWKVALNSANLINFLTNDILDYSKIEAGKLTLFFDRIPLSSTIEETVKLMEFTATQKGNRICV